MRITEILKAIDAHQRVTGETDRAISIGAGGSEDMVRNWRRRLAKDEGDQGVNVRSAESVMKYIGAPPPDESQDAAGNGFSEPVRLWESHRKAELESALRYLCPNAKHPSTYVLNRNIPEYYHRAGDVLVIDLKAQAGQGDIVIASRVDTQSGSADTIIGRLLPPFIAPPDSTAQPILIDNTVAVMGPVLSVFSNPED